MAIVGLFSTMASEAAPVIARKIGDLGLSFVQSEAETKMIGCAANIMGRASTNYGATAGRVMRQAHSHYGQIGDMQTMTGLTNDVKVAVSKNLLKSPSVKSPGKLKSPFQKTAPIKADNPANGALGSLNRLNPNPIFNPMKARARQSLAF